LLSRFIASGSFGLADVHGLDVPDELIWERVKVDKALIKLSGLTGTASQENELKG